MSIKAKLILFALLTAAVPLLGLSLTAYHSSKGALSELINAELSTLAEERVQQLEGFFEEASTDLVSWSNLRIMQDVLTDDEEQELAAELTRLRQRYPDFANLLVANDRGEVVSGDAKAYAGADDQALLQQLSRQVLAGQPFQSSVISFGGQPSLVLARPIRADYDPDTLIGVLIGVLDWTQIKQRLQQVAIAGKRQNGDQLLVLRAGDSVLYATAEHSPPWNRPNSPPRPGWSSARPAVAPPS